MAQNYTSSINVGGGVKLTDEQKNIIDLSRKLNNNEILAIQACAGSGKTSTLQYIASANPNARFLYLAYNKAIAEGAKSKFPRDVKVTTIHSWAHSYLKDRIEDFELADKLTYFDVNEILDENLDKILESWERAQKLKTQKSSESKEQSKEDDKKLSHYVLETLKKAREAKVILDYKTVSSVINIFDNFLKNINTFDDDFPDKELIKFLFQATLDRKLPITHNFYLRFYQMAEDKKLDEQYDFILLDEAQDTDEVMLSIFLHNNCKKILVGDTFQNIYGFKKSINAFERVKADYGAELSKSFRCKQQILDYANFLLGKFSDKPFTPMESGFKQDNESKTKAAYITLKNAEIVELLGKIADTQNPQDFHLLKEPDSIFAPIWALKNFYARRVGKIPQEYAYITHFKTKEELHKYIEETNDSKLKKAKKYILSGIDVPKMYELAKNLYNNKEAPIVITNAYQAKGLEWDIVVLSSDFDDLSELKKKKKQKEFTQELNLFYVAITRAKKRLIDKSSNIETYITDRANGNFFKHLEAIRDDEVVSISTVKKEAYWSFDGACEEIREQELFVIDMLEVRHEIFLEDIKKQNLTSENKSAKIAQAKLDYNKKIKEIKEKARQRVAQRREKVSAAIEEGKEKELIESAETWREKMRLEIEIERQKESKAKTNSDRNSGSSDSEIQETKHKTSSASPTTEEYAKRCEEDEARKHRSAQEAKAEAEKLKAKKEKRKKEMDEYMKVCKANAELEKEKLLRIYEGR